MKTKAEYRNEALLLAKENGYDKVHFQGMFDNREVYTGDYNVPCVTGLPQIIFASEKGVEFDTSGDPFTILHRCKKLPSVVFEYECIVWCGPHYSYKLFADGRFIKTDYADSGYFADRDPSLDTELVILESPELVKAVKQVIEENKEALQKLPREISNPLILDGASETIKLGRMKFSGCNILTVSVRDSEIRREKSEINEVYRPMLQAVCDFQKIFRKIQKTINGFVKVRLVG